MKISQDRIMYGALIVQLGISLHVKNGETTIMLRVKIQSLELSKLEQ